MVSPSLLVILFFSIFSNFSAVAATKVKGYNNIIIHSSTQPISTSSSDYPSSASPSVTVFELEFPANPVRLDEQGLPLVMTSEEYEKHLESQEDYYYPVDMVSIEHEEHPEENFMVKILKKYRHDLGYPVFEDLSENLSTREELLVQATHFFTCLGQKMNSFKPFSKNKFKNLTIALESFDFLRSLGRIPRNDFSLFTTEQCDELKSRLPFKNTKEMIKYYLKEQQDFNLINWDYLDTTHFKYNEFPVIGKIFRTYRTGSLGHYYRQENVFTAKGRDWLKEYQEHIRFHNPKTIEGKRMILFQKLYKLYFSGVGKNNANPNFIDWSRCTVKNWPQFLFMNDIYSWTEEYIDEGMKFVEKKAIKFYFATKSAIGTGFLGNVPNFFDKPIIYAHFAEDPVIYEFDPFTQKKYEVLPTTLSDSEEACGSHMNGFEFEKIELGMEENGILEFNFEDESEDEIVEALPTSSRKRKAKASAEPKSSAETKSIKISSELTSEIPSNPEYFTIKTHDHLNGIDILIGSRSPSTKTARKKVLESVAQIYFEDTGIEGPIDWNAIHLAKFKNHIIPFSTDLETEADIQIITELIKYGALAFLNPVKNFEDDQIRVYERIYSVYKNACGEHANPFDFYLEDMIVKGWPRGIGKIFSRWSKSHLAHLNEAIDSGSLTMKPNKNFQKIIELKLSKKSQCSADNEEISSVPQKKRRGRPSRIIKQGIPEEESVSYEGMKDLCTEELKLGQVYGKSNFNDEEEEKQNIMEFALKDLLAL